MSNLPGEPGFSPTSAVLDFMAAEDHRRDVAEILDHGYLEDAETSLAITAEIRPDAHTRLMADERIVGHLAALRAKAKAEDARYAALLAQMHEGS